MGVLTSGDLRDVLEAERLPGAVELGAALQEVCGGADDGARILELRRLKTNVYRVRLETGDGGTRSLMLKSSNPALARHNQLVARRWLPAKIYPKPVIEPEPALEGNFATKDRIVGRVHAGGEIVFADKSRPLLIPFPSPAAAASSSMKRGRLG